jgi:DNA-directed RNA polymerase subunit RPC12/RpoP
LAGFPTDGEGVLDTRLQAVHGIWTPPSAMIGNGTTRWFRDSLCLVYPVPKDLVPKDLVGAGEAVGQAGIAAEFGTRIRSRLHLAALLPQFEEAGWRKREDAKGLLEEVLALTDLEILSHYEYADHYEYTEFVHGPPPPITGPKLRSEQEAVRRFAEKWGPLWLGPTHRNDYQTLLPTRVTADTPFWPRYEPVRALLNRANEVRLVMDIAAQLRQGKAAKAEWWSELGIDIYPSAEEQSEREAKKQPPIEPPGLEYQRQLLASILTMRFSSVGAIRLNVDWTLGAKGRPQIAFTTGIGFLSVLWMQVAQEICGAEGIYTCSNCGRQYFRTTRKPAKGRLNFCSKCSIKNEGSKHQWAKRNRERG